MCMRALIIRLGTPVEDSVMDSRHNVDNAGIPSNRLPGSRFMSKEEAFDLLANPDSELVHSKIPIGQIQS